MESTDHPRRLGVLGGMAWPSTAEAYRLLNQTVNQARGGVASADVVVVSLDFAEVEALQSAGDWEGAGRLLGDGARRLAAAGAEAVLLCTNTMHIVAGAIEAIGGIPLIHIADATAASIRGAGQSRIGLLGTRFTMEGDFYAGRLRDHGLEVLVPEPADRQTVHRVIFDELVNGEFRDESRAAYLDVIARLVDRGAEGVIAGCTEIEQLLDPSHFPPSWGHLRYYPTTSIHVQAAAEWILTGSMPDAPRDV